MGGKGLSTRLRSKTELKFQNIAKKSERLSGTKERVLSNRGIRLYSASKYVGVSECFSNTNDSTRSLLVSDAKFTGLRFRNTPNAKSTIRR